jgi:nucleoside-diphosphate-sugar epimerase
MNTQSALTRCSWLDPEQLRNSDILITGGTGLIGYNLLLELSRLQREYGLRLHALVRSKSAAAERFAAFLDRVNLIEGDVCGDLNIDGPLDYIVHGASVTSSRFFVEQPVETIMTSVMGTRNLLELARTKGVKSMVYLSSMEVYGAVDSREPLTESMLGHVDPLNVRSSYPESKRMCESLCVAYAKEYGVPVKIARLAQTFGPGLQPQDKRAIVQFLESALAGRNIEIKASGESSRMYLYTFDAVSALLTLLLRGADGEAYNLADKNTYCSIRTLAQTIVRVCGAKSRVLVNTGSEEERRIYPPDSFLRLDTTKLENLGWKALYSLEEGLASLGKAISENGGRS